MTWGATSQQGGGGGGGGLAQPLNNDHSPGGNWSLNRTPDDSSGNINTLTANGTNSPLYADMLPNMAGGLIQDAAVDLTFTRGSYDVELDIVSDLTIEFIIQARNVPVSTIREILSMGNAGPTDTSYRIIHNTNQLTFLQREGGVASVADWTDLQLGLTPAYVVFVRTGTTSVELFINGVSHGAKVLTGTLTTDIGKRFRIGANSFSANTGDHVISNVVITGSALTPAQIKTRHNSSVGAVLGVLP